MVELAVEVKEMREKGNAGVVEWWRDQRGRMGMGHHFAAAMR